MGVIFCLTHFPFVLFFIAWPGKTEATNTAPSPKRTTRATSRADKGTSRGSVENDETTETDGKKHA